MVLIATRMQINSPNLYCQLLVLTFFFCNQNDTHDLPIPAQCEPSSNIPPLQRSPDTSGSYSSPADKL